jgi:hypothetical protein
MKKLFTIYSEDDGLDAPKSLSIEFYQEELQLLSGAIRPKNIKNDDPRNDPSYEKYMKNGDTYVINAEKTGIGLGDEDGIILILEDNFMESDLTFLMNLKKYESTYFKISNYGFLCKFRYNHMTAKTLITNQGIGKFDVFYDETTNTILVPSLYTAEKNE